MNGANTGCFTTGLIAPIAGTYVATAEMTWPGDSTGVRKLQLLGGGAVLTTQQVPPAGTSNTIQTIATVTRLAAGDTVTIQASHTATSSLDIQDANMTLSWIGP